MTLINLPRMFPLLLCSILWAVDAAVVDAVAVDVEAAGVDSVVEVVPDDEAAEQWRAFALVVEVPVGNGFVAVAVTGTEPADIESY